MQSNLRKARLEAAHWVLRTSVNQFSVCTQDFPVSLTHDLDAPFQRDTCVHLSLCMAQIGNSASSPKQDSLVCFCSLVGAFACSESSLLGLWWTRVVEWTGIW